LDRFSDNMFMGAANAFTGETGKGRNVVSGERGVTLSDIARDYRSRGLKWVVIGDRNYGEGSSREHAALSPRLLGGAAVIARSFARIHETNLKKQGLLALTFQNEADYDRIREDDRISLIGLAALAAGEPVSCRIMHADDTTEALVLMHGYSKTQLAWFRAGAALNLVASGSG
jgi:aconitate hydratase